MKINGSLVFDGSSASEIQNLRLEKVSVLPVHNSLIGNVGRLLFVTGSGIIYVGIADSWIPLATGGDATALLAEVDAIEAAVGLNSNGTFAPGAYTGNLATATSVVNLFEKIQALIAAAVLATSDEVAARLAADSLLDGRIVTEVAARIAGDATNATAISAETTRATGAEGVIAGNLASEITRATAAEGVLTADIASEIARATLAETTVNGRVTTEVADRIAADTVLQTAITAEASTARAAEGVLRTDLASEVTRSTAADTAQTAATDAEVTRATAAEALIASNLATEISRATSRETAIEADFNARVQGLSWKNPVRVATVGNIDLAIAAAGYDGVTLVTGDRVLVRSQAILSENGIYVFNGTGAALTRSVDMDLAAEFNAASVYVREGAVNADLGFTQTAEVVTVGTTAVSFVQFNGAGSVTAGNGLTQTGNVVNVVAADGSITVTADAIAVSAATQTAISDNTAAISAETTRATTAEGVNAAAIMQEATDRAAADTAETAARIADVNTEEARAIAAEGVLRTDLASEVTRATAAEGVLAVDIANEVAARIAGDATNAAAISSEVTRATAAEGVLRTDLASEVTRATAAEGVLTASVTAVNARVGKMYFLYNGATAAATHTVTHSLGQMYCSVTVVDGTDEVVIPQSIKFLTANSLEVTFNTAIACKVVIMGLAAV